MNVVYAVSVPGRAARQSTSFALLKRSQGMDPKRVAILLPVGAIRPIAEFRAENGRRTFAVRDAQVSHLEANERQTVILLLISSKSRGSLSLR
jgi:hypothetical protein